MNWNSYYINRIIDNWLDEDLGSGDLTVSGISKEIGKAYWISKEDGIFCGAELIKKIYERIDPKIKLDLLINDGEKFTKHQRILELTGSPKSLLAGERTSLNIAMHLSGISSYTAKLVDKLKNTNIKLADTRKTTPGLRILEKYAFKCGGGINHRMGLFDAAMVKENHIAWSENLDKVVRKIRENSPFTTHIIIEAENINQAREAILAGADSILLDEIEPDLLRTSIENLRNLSRKQSKKNNISIEVSGINPNEIDKYFIDGINLISTSSATTKSNWIDFSMRYIS